MSQHCGALPANRTTHFSTHSPYQAEIPEQAAMRIGGVDGFVPYRASATLLATALSPPPSIGRCRCRGCCHPWCCCSS